LQILVEDDRGTAEGARAAAAQAIQQGAELILGPLFAPAVSAAAQVARPAGVPVVAFSTDTGVAARGVYLLSFLPQTDVERIVGFAGMRGRHAIAALLPANGYGTVVEAALRKAASGSNGRVVAIERYQTDRVAMQVSAAAMAPLFERRDADTLLMPGAAGDAAVLAEALAARNVRSGAVQFLGSGQWDDPETARSAALAGAWYPAPDKAGYEAFAARYRAAFGEPPLRAASLGYDAVSLAAGLAARYGAQGFTPQSLTNPNGFLGVDGAFRFLPDGTNQRGLAVYQVGNGTVWQIDPAPRTFSRMM
ncbi:MAG: penicillin-binding protein activator, partial [Rhizobiales bacterium]|nr:penicillin-binding protein activator [Hyphomicrobiales bacterium]